MSRSAPLRFVASAFALCLAAALGAIARDAIPAAHAQVPPASLEYQTASTKDVPTDEEGDKLLNSFSKEGWRFAGTIATKNGPLAVFERARRAIPTPRKLPPTKLKPDEID